MKMKKTVRILTLVLFIILLVCGLSVSAGAKSRKSKKKNKDNSTVVITAAPSREDASAGEASKNESSGTEIEVEESGEYTSKEEVALYLHLYGHLPSNYITKKEANELGWSGGPLWDYAPGKSIGGSRFGNYEELLPVKKGRTYYECDIDYDGGKRNAKRIVWSDDGLIFYTEDHYNTFEPLY